MLPLLILAGVVMSLLILRTIVGISNTDTGIDPGFVDIKSTAIEFQDFKRQVTTS